MTPFEKRIADRTASFKTLATQLRTNHVVSGAAVTRLRPTAGSIQLLDDSAMPIIPQPVHAPYFEKPVKSQPAKIATDDPEALMKLATKLQGLENQAADMKRANEYVRKGDIDSLRKLGYSSEAIEKLFNTDDDKEGGYSKSEFSRLYASMRRVKVRIAELNNLAGRQSVTETNDRYMYQECMETCRILFTFARKPQAWVRELMSRHGFRFSSNTNTWQRMLTNEAILSANFLRKELVKEKVNFFE